VMTSSSSLLLILFFFFFIRDGILVLYVYLQMAGPHTLDIQSVELVLDHSKR
jgi:hypothetical protein